MSHLHSGVCLRGEQTIRGGAGFLTEDGAQSVQFLKTFVSDLPENTQALFQFLGALIFMHTYTAQWIILKFILNNHETTYRGRYCW